VYVCMCVSLPPSLVRSRARELRKRVHRVVSLHEAYTIPLFIPSHSLEVCTTKMLPCRQRGNRFLRTFCGVKLFTVHIILHSPRCSVRRYMRCARPASLPDGR
jgi:hypothetical protein